MQTSKKPVVPANAQMPPERQRIRSRSELCFPVWEMGCRVEKPMGSPDKKAGPKRSGD